MSQSQRRGSREIDLRQLAGGSSGFRKEQRQLRREQRLSGRNSGNCGGSSGLQAAGNRSTKRRALALALFYAAEMHRAPQELRTYFLTAATANRKRLFQVEATALLMMTHLQACRERKRFELHAFVLMPDHIHLLLTPAPDVSLEKAMQFIKGGFSFQLKSKLDVWGRGYNETQILDGAKYLACKRYIERNPVRKHMVERPELYPYTSAGQPGLTDERSGWL